MNTNEQRMFINSVGEGGIWVCNKGSSNIENGDYITSSSVTGYGMKQILHEGILTNFTVAKITCDCNFSLEKMNDDFKVMIEKYVQKTEQVQITLPTLPKLEKV